MQLIRRPLATHETDYELIWLLVSTGTLGFAATWLALNLPWPVCLFHEMTGHPCATCGATRSAIAFFHGQFLQAWKWNPLAFVTYCAMAVFNLYALAVVTARGPRFRIVQLSSGEKKFLRLTAIVLLLANWVYLLNSNLFL
jgi:Protein of unknown function (DUF2752)